MLLVQGAVAWLSWLSAKLLTPSQSRTSLGINEQDFACSPRGFTVQQARAQLCDPSGWDCVMFLDQFMCKGFHQIGINVFRQLELSYPSCARCFPLMSILPLGAATAVTPMWIAPSSADRASFQVFM